MIGLEDYCRFFQLNGLLSLPETVLSTFLAKAYANSVHSSTELRTSFWICVLGRHIETGVIL